MGAEIVLRNVRMFKKLVVGVIAVLSCAVSAAYETNEFHKLSGELHRVVSPDLVIVKVTKEQKEFLLSVKLSGLKVPAGYKNDCDDSEPQCILLQSYLEDRTFGVAPSGLHKSGIKGDLIIDDKSLVVRLIKAGLYNVDVSNGRSLLLLMAEKEAKCLYRGIWKQYRGDIKTSAQCQTL